MLSKTELVEIFKHEAKARHVADAIQVIARSIWLGVNDETKVIPTRECVLSLPCGMGTLKIETHPISDEVDAGYSPQLNTIALRIR